MEANTARMDANIQNNNIKIEVPSPTAPTSWAPNLPTIAVSVIDKIGSAKPATVAGSAMRLISLKVIVLNIQKIT